MPKFQHYPLCCSKVIKHFSTFSIWKWRPTNHRTGENSPTFRPFSEHPERRQLSLNSFLPFQKERNSPGSLQGVAQRPVRVGRKEERSARGNEENKTGNLLSAREKTILQVAPLRKKLNNGFENKYPVSATFWLMFIYLFYLEHLKNVLNYTSLHWKGIITLKTITNCRHWLDHFQMKQYQSASDRSGKGVPIIRRWEHERVVKIYEAIKFGIPILWLCSMRKNDVRW